MIWLFQIVFLNSFYENMKTNSIKKVANEIQKTYEAGNYESEINQLAFKNSILIYITDTNGNLIFYSDEHGPWNKQNDQNKPVDINNVDNQRPLPLDFNDLLTKLKESENNHLYYAEHRNEFSGKTFDNSFAV